jgi:DNA (cytosine-5)-methyltransferase 1
MGNRSRLPNPDHLTPTIERFRLLGVPWVIENVLGARRHMPNAVQLTGGMFGLGVHRPRLFMSNVLILCPQREPAPVGGIGVYGRDHDGRRLWSHRRTSGTYRAASSLAEAQEAMGMDWGDWHGVKEALPPAYTAHIGRQLMAYLEERVA